MCHGSISLLIHLVWAITSTSFQMSSQQRIKIISQSQYQITKQYEGKILLYQYAFLNLALPTLIWCSTLNDAILGTISLGRSCNLLLLLVSMYFNWPITASAGLKLHWISNLLLYWLIEYVKVHSDTGASCFVFIPKVEVYSRKKMGPFCRLRKFKKIWEFSAFRRMRPDITHPHFRTSYFPK